jgi:hypothetical protein
MDLFSLLSASKFLFGSELATHGFLLNAASAAAFHRVVTPVTIGSV